MSLSTHLPSSSSPLILKFLQLILSIESSSLSTSEKEYARFFQSSGELIRDFFGAERVSAFVYVPEEERFVDGWSSLHAESKQEHDRANAWAALFIEQPSTVFQRSWRHHEVEDQARQVSSLGEHHAWMIPWIEQQPNEGFMVIEEPHHPLADDPQVAPLLSTLATMVYSIIRRLHTGVMARVSTTAVDEVNYRIAQFSHQIRTPLMGMLNAMQLMADQQVTWSQKEYFDIAWNSAKTMQLMLDRILDIAKLDSHTPEQNLQAFDLETELLVIIKNQLLAAQEKGLVLHLTFDHPLHFKVIGDNVLLHHVLMNLLSNAIKYTNEGSVTLSVNTVKFNRDTIKLEFAVKDTGIGIPKTYLSQLFKPYFRVNDLYSQVSNGTGLGLPIVQDILQRINSRLEIDTVEGKGSTFSFILQYKILEDPKLYDFHLLLNKEVCLIHQYPEPSPELMQRLISLQLQITTVSHDGITSDKTNYTLSPTTDYVILDGASDWMVEWLSRPSVVVPPSASMLGYYCCKDVGHHQRMATDYKWLSSTQSRLEWRDILLKSQAQKAPISAPKLKQVIQPWKVMLIDDNPINLKTLEALLTKAGLEVHIATDSIQGLRQIGNEVFDFILLDIKMPELSGPEVLQRIRLMRHPNATVPVFAATAYAFDKEQKEFLDLGFNEVITKPVDINLLLRLMMRYKEVHFDEEIAPTWGTPTQQETFNEAEFNHHYEGLDSLKSEVMQLFFEQSEGSLRRIQSAITDMNFEKIAFEAHYYKGSCSYLSAPRITWLCTKLIEFAKRKDAEPIPQILAQLIQETTLFNYRVRDYLGHQAPTSERPLQATSPRPSHQP